MFISKNHYKKLVTHNKKLAQEVNDLESQIKYLQVTNNEYYRGACKWRTMYDKMRELFDNREIESPIVAQRNAEIDALKHMLERVEAKEKETRTENDKLKEVVSNHGTGTSNLLMLQDRLIEENERQRQTINNINDSYTHVVQQREDYKVQLRGLQEENDEVVNELKMVQRKLDLLDSMINEHLKDAKLFEYEEDVIMWGQLLKVVRE